MNRDIPRKRLEKSANAVPAIEDPLEFKKNKSSDNARNIKSVNEIIKVELWFDKHYLERSTHGDSDGKRHGIDTIIVENLVLNSIKHLLFYSACVNGFMFLNHRTNNVQRNIRIVCQEQTEDGLLNVAIEVHYNSLQSYEVTVKTAMCVDNFKLHDNQYAIEIFNSETSSLKRMTNKRICEVCSI